MKILYKKPGEAPEIRDVANDLETLQDLVGGYIETVTVGNMVIICNEEGNTVASISKELFNFTDTYTIDVHDPVDSLHALMVVLAIDAEKCSRN